MWQSNLSIKPGDPPLIKVKLTQLRDTELQTN